MYAGRIVEQGPTDQIVSNPRHPYTKGLIQALPQGGGGGRRLHQIPGMMPNLTSIPPGCAFHPRCEFAMDICRNETPRLLDDGRTPGQVACHLYAQAR
jgi:peptide/nickel transport system ATP-binding protein